MWFDGSIRKRLGQLEDAVRDLRAAVARFEATDVARAAAALDAASRLERTADRLRKQADRLPNNRDEDADDDFYEKLAAARGRLHPAE